jgi:S-formylglutathione hydrolase FrmB
MTIDFFTRIPHVLVLLHEDRTINPSYRIKVAEKLKSAARTNSRPKVLSGLLLLAILQGCGASADTSSSKNSPLTMVSARQLSDRLYEYQVYSPALLSTTPIRVLVPVGYSGGASQTYPVLYLLHGCCNGSRGFASYTEQTDFEAFTRDFSVVVVMPEGGAGGQYSDWYNDGRFGPPRWEQYHLHELLPWAEQNFRVRDDRRGRMIMGVSMGGHGALAYAAKYPDRFGSTAGISPSVDTNTLLGQRLLDDSALLDGGDRNAVWGPRITQEVRWRGHNPWDLAENLGTVNVFLRTGNGRLPERPLFIDLVEYGVHEMATNLHHRLNELGISHRFEDYGFGSHTDEYFEESLHQLLPQLLAVAQDQAPEPRAFSYRSIDARFEVFGWQVEVQRDVVEFLRLREVSAHGFNVSGSGVVAVTTAAWFQANTDFEILVDGVLRLVRSDRDGRLRMTIDLGASRQIQEYRSGSQLGYLQSATVEIRPHRIQ